MDMRERLQQQLLHVKAGRKIVNRLQATGHARQLVPDSEHLLNRTVAENFANCESRAQTQSQSKRRGVLAKLKREDGLSPQFSRAARRNIPAEVLQRVRELNWMDLELHDLATDISSSTIAVEREKGMKELKKGPLKAQQQPGKGAGALNATAATNASASASADAADPTAKPAGVGEATDGNGADSGSLSDSDTASVSSSVGSADSVKDEL